MITWKELQKLGESMLNDAHVDDSAFDSLQLLLKISGFDMNGYLLNANAFVSSENQKYFIELINRRIKKEPLQYILEKWDFYNESFNVGKGVLIPRPETEELVDLCINIIKNNQHKVIYDLCAGSGCIGFTIAKECPFVHVYLFEYFDDALFYTEKNKEELKIQNATVIKCDVLKGMDFSIPKADFIISNPPYIESQIVKTLQSEVLNEPITALDGGEDGLLFYRAIAKHWFSQLNENGQIAFECAENQCKSIENIFIKKAFCESKKDLFGLDRFVFGKKL